MIRRILEAITEKLELEPTDPFKKKPKNAKPEKPKGGSSKAKQAAEKMDKLTKGELTHDEASELLALSKELGGVSPAPSGALEPKGTYGSHWGLSDLYDDWHATLQAAWDSGKDFTAKWGSKKEIVWCTLRREGNTVDVEVEVQTDDPYEPSMGDTFYNAAWEAFGTLVKNETLAAIGAAMDADEGVTQQVGSLGNPDGDFDSELDVEGGSEYPNKYIKSATVPATTLDAVIEKAGELWDELDKKSGEGWQKGVDAMVSLVLGFVKQNPKKWGFASPKVVDALHAKWLAEKGKD